MRKVNLVVGVLVLSVDMAVAAVPVVDAGAIATTISENVKTLAQLKSQLDVLNSQIEQAKQFADDTKNRLEGNWKLSDIVNNDQFLSALPKEARDILTAGMNVPGLRDKYGLKTDKEGLQEQFDSLMAYRERTESNYKNTVKRLNDLNRIKVLNDLATTPAQKADVANKLSLIQLEFAEEQAALRQVEDMVNAQREIERNAEIERFRKAVREGRERFENRFK